MLFFEGDHTDFPNGQHYFSLALLELRARGGIVSRMEETHMISLFILALCGIPCSSPAAQTRGIVCAI